MDPSQRDEELRSLRETVSRLQLELSDVSLRLKLISGSAISQPSPFAAPTTSGAEPPAAVIAGPPPVIVSYSEASISDNSPAASAKSALKPLTDIWKAQVAKPPDVEMRIGAKWFNRIGALILFAGVAFLVKYSFERGWISPLVRVLMGATTGLALVVIGQISLRREMRQFAAGLIGAGIAMLYLSVYGAHIFYALISSDIAFALYCVATAAGMLLAWHASMQAIIILTIIGAFMTPPALQTHRNAQVALLTYLLIVNIGFLVVSSLRGWDVPRLLCWIGTFLIFNGWGQTYYEPTVLWTTLAFIFAFYVVFQAEALLSARTDRAKQRWILSGIIHASNVAFFFAVVALTEDDYREYLGLFAVIAGSVQWMLAWLIRREDRLSQPSQTALCIDGAGMLALAAPLQFDGQGVVIAWGVQAIVSLCFARRIPGVWLRVKATGILLAAFGHLFLFEKEDSFFLQPLVSTDLWHLNRLILYFVFVSLSALCGAICLTFRRNIGKLDQITAGLLAAFSTALLLGTTAHQYDRYVATWCWVGICVAWAIAGRWVPGARLKAIGLAVLIAGKFILFDLIEAVNRHWQAIDGVVFNRVVLTSLLVATASMIARRLSKKLPSVAPNSDAQVMQALFWVLTPLVLIAMGTFEIFRTFRFEQSVMQRFERPQLAMNVALSVLWSLGATIVLTIGLVRLIRAMRYFAIALFAITIAKVMIVDLSYLETIYRVVSFIVLGILLLLASFFYQKRWIKMQAAGQVE